MVLGLFSKTSKEQIDDCARTLIRELTKRYPLQTAQSKETSKRCKAEGKALDAAYVRAQAFHAQNKLGVYGKARLGNTFQRCHPARYLLILLHRLLLVPINLQRSDGRLQSRGELCWVK